MKNFIIIVFANNIILAKENYLAKLILNIHIDIQYYVKRKK
tara:strand:+ start:643 stop:765 length:123 start_codon:yes stop_codon:yes gene_type:complete